MKAILRSVSRSFYLTIRFLPRPLRDPVGLAYLLARATDTIADTASIPAATRLTTLRAVARAIAGDMDFSSVAEGLRDFSAGQSDPHERILIENLDGCVDWLSKIDAADRADIREVLKTIVRGQELDLVRFADPATAVPLRTSAELDEYTYLVAGSVGAFWTKLGFRHCPNFATRAPNEMTALGTGYGEGLQLINVLRDRAADTAAGRDYLPAEELAGSTVENVFTGWLGQAEEKISAGIDYCSALTNWRVRYATALPALIGARTIALLRAAGPTAERIKVPRKEVRRILAAALFAALSPLALRALFQRLLAF
ncbi:MAG TPA: squalene/phytoene synthase family protein [Chthoniobacterales bacterium]|nr:squalene/phytoene synthase family protein [Chthoniobacterales bacterium]